MPATRCSRSRSTPATRCSVVLYAGWWRGHSHAACFARIRAIMGPLDYPGTVFGVAASGTGTPMSDVARRYARGLALHHRDHVVPDERHTPSRQDPQP